MTPLCFWCGEPEVLEIAEVWTDSNFLLSTCCEGLLTSVSAGISDDPAWGRDLLRRLGAEELTGHRLRRVSDGEGCHPMLDWQLDLCPVAFSQARAFIARHHVHCPPPVIIWTVKRSIGGFDFWVVAVSRHSGHQRASPCAEGQPCVRSGAIHRPRRSRRL